MNANLNSQPSLSPTLKKILPSLSKKALDLFKELEQLVSPVGNFRKLRKAVQKAEKETALPPLYVLIQSFKYSNI